MLFCRTTLHSLHRVALRRDVGGTRLWLLVLLVDGVRLVPGGSGLDLLCPLDLLAGLGPVLHRPHVARVHSARSPQGEDLLHHAV